MIGLALIELGKIILPVLIKEIFMAEEAHVSPRSGNTKRDVVHKAIIKMIVDAGLPFDAGQLGALIDAQVTVLKDNGVSWALGSIAINKVLKCIVEQEETDPSGQSKLEKVKVRALMELTALDLYFDGLEKFIQDQVNLFDAFGIFLKKTK